MTYELSLLPPLSESYLRLGRKEEAHTCLDRAREILAMPEDWKGLAAGVALAEAILAVAEQRWPAAETSFQQAVETNQRHGWLYDEARALYEWAVMGLERDGPGDRRRGMELLDQSLANFQRCDAKRDVERVLSRQKILKA